MDDDYLDSLASTALEPLSGIAAEDSNPESNSARSSMEGSGSVFLASDPHSSSSPPYRTRSNYRHDTPKQNDRSYYWWSEMPVFETATWNKLTVKVPRLCPKSEEKRIKNQLVDSFVKNTLNASGNWQDKYGLLTNSFLTHCPAIDTESQAAAIDVYNYKSNVEGPVLKRPDPRRRFYLKTDFSAKAMGAALLQPEETEEAEEAMRKEIERTAKCEFDKTIGGIRLRPTAFYSRRCTEREKDYHSYIGETRAGLFGMRKNRHYLMGREFTWIADCKGMMELFEGDYEPTHTIQRWKMEMLRYDFVMYHRNARMLYECDLLSRYNRYNPITEEKRTTKEDLMKPRALLAIQHEEERMIPRTNKRIIHTGQHHQRTPLAAATDPGRTITIIGTGLNTVKQAMNEAGLEAIDPNGTDESETWRNYDDVPTLSTFLNRMKDPNKKQPGEWIIATRAQDQDENELLLTLLTAKDKHLRAAIIVWTKQDSHEAYRNATRLAQELQREQPTWTTTTGAINNEHVEGHCKSEQVYCIWTPNQVTPLLPVQQETEPGTMETILDPPNHDFSDYHHTITWNNDGTADIIRRETQATETVLPIKRSDAGPNPFHSYTATIQTDDEGIQQTTRPLRPHELLKMIGANTSILQSEVPWKDTSSRLQDTTPKHIWQTLLTAVYSAEITQHDQDVEQASYYADQDRHQSLLNNYTESNSSSNTGSNSESNFTSSNS